MGLRNIFYKLANDVKKYPNIVQLTKTLDEGFKEVAEHINDGGSEVVVTPLLTSGEKIATISVDGDDSDIYAPGLEYGTTTNSFNTVNGSLVDELKVSMVPVQDLHGYSKPWAGGAGKNKYKMRDTNYSNNGITATVNSDGTLDINGQATATTNLSLTSNTAELTTLIAEGGLFTLSLKNATFHSSTFNVTIGYKETADSPNSFIVPNTPVNIPVGAIFLSSNLYVANGVTVDTVINFAMQLEKGSTATSFEPYSNICPISGHTQVQSKINNTTYTTSLGGTEYGGDVEQVGGTGEVTYGVTNLGTASYTYYGDGLFGITNNTIKPETHINIICSCYKSYAGINNITGTSTAKAYMSDGDIASKEGSKEIFIKDTRYSDADVLKAALSGQSVVYELATPTALTLTGQIITAEVGENNVSAPLTGQSIEEVKYHTMITIDDVIKLTT